MSSDDAQFPFDFVALPLSVVEERMNEEKKVDLGHFTMSEELTTWAMRELSCYFTWFCLLFVHLLTARWRVNV